MAIWKRKHTDKRTYFNTDTALIRKQESGLTIKLLGIKIIDRSVSFEAESDDKKNSVGFNKK